MSSPLLLSRPACNRRVGSICLLAAAALLAGCVRYPPQTYGYAPATMSIKDSWETEVRPEPPAPARPRPRVKTARLERPGVSEAPRAPARPEAPRPQGSELDCGSDAACLSQLRTLIDDPERRWIGSPLPTAEYARGVRLFAYRVLRARLTCSELVIALAEIEAARKPLTGPVPGITPAQAARARMLSDEVEGELRVERANRCNA
jgi:hypothetical protein